MDNFGRRRNVCGPADDRGSRIAVECELRERKRKKIKEQTIKDKVKK